GYFSKLRQRRARYKRKITCYWQTPEWDPSSPDLPGGEEWPHKKAPKPSGWGALGNTGTGRCQSVRPAVIQGNGPHDRRIGSRRLRPESGLPGYGSARHGSGTRITHDNVDGLAGMRRLSEERIALIGRQLEEVSLLRGIRRHMRIS